MNRTLFGFLVTFVGAIHGIVKAQDVRIDVNLLSLASLQTEFGRCYGLATSIEGEPLSFWGNPTDGGSSLSTIKHSTSPVDPRSQVVNVLKIPSSLISVRSSGYDHGNRQMVIGYGTTIKTTTTVPPPILSREWMLFDLTKENRFAEQITEREIDAMWFCKTQAGIRIRCEQQRNKLFFFACPPSLPWRAVCEIELQSNLWQIKETPAGLVVLQCIRDRGQSRLSVSVVSNKLQTQDFNQALSNDAVAFNLASCGNDRLIDLFVQSSAGAGTLVMLRIAVDSGENLDISVRPIAGTPGLRNLSLVDAASLPDDEGNYLLFLGESLDYSLWRQDDQGIEQIIDKLYGESMVLPMYSLLSVGVGELQLLGLSSTELE